MGEVRGGKDGEEAPGQSAADSGDTFEFLPLCSATLNETLNSPSSNKTHTPARWAGLAKTARFRKRP